MSSFENGWALTLIVFLPLVGAAAVLAIPKAQEEAQKWTALLFAGGSFVLSVIVVFQFDYGAAQKIQFGPDSTLTWIGAINSNYSIGIDGISLPLLVLSTFMTVLAIIYSWDHWPEPHNPKIFSALILVLATGMNGTFVALDLILFFVFFEVVLLPMYFMIGIWGDRNKVIVPVLGLETEMRLYASIKFFLFTLFGSAFMLLGFLTLYFKSGMDTFDIRLCPSWALPRRRSASSRSGCSPPCSSASPSRCRCSRCTPGCPTPTPPPPRSARCCWPPSC